jgi:hypothetical protein
MDAMPLSFSFDGDQRMPGLSLGKSDDVGLPNPNRVA